MYILFLTLRYLTRKLIVAFPILVVALCVMMMIIVSSIMGGFVQRVLDANRNLMGDIVVDARGRAGWPRYEEVLKELRAMPDVAVATPVVRAYGLINFPEQRANTWAQIVGIDPEQRAQVSPFQSTLFRQYQAPRQAVEDLSGYLPATGQALAQTSDEHFLAVQKDYDELYAESFRLGGEMANKGKQTGLTITYFSFAGVLALGGGTCLALAIFKSRRWPWLVGLALLVGAGTCFTLGFMHMRRFERMDERMDQTTLDLERAYRVRNYAAGLPANTVIADRAALEKLLIPAIPNFDVPPGMIRNNGQPIPQNGCIVGAQMGLYKRDGKGNFRRDVNFRFHRALLTVVPVTQKGNLLVNQANQDEFTVMDDTYSRVYDVDSTFVYAPFARVQEMALMNAFGEGDNAKPARCSEILVKIKDSNPEKIKEVATQIRGIIRRLGEKYVDLQIEGVDVQSWDQKQAKYIGAVRNEKTMLTCILGLMSMVVLVVIFLIFYMIVRDKTRDIGIIKALGASELGVASIFLTYGAFVGAVGGLLGMGAGVLFVWNTNYIHDRILYNIFGLMIWDRSIYLFDRIPDTVNWWEVWMYVGLALVAGTFGALIPALKAGVQDPVRAVRYE